MGNPSSLPVDVADPAAVGPDPESARRQAEALRRHYRQLTGESPDGLEDWQLARRLLQITRPDLLDPGQDMTFTSWDPAAHLDD